MWRPNGLIDRAAASAAEHACVHMRRARRQIHATALAHKPNGNDLESRRNKSGALSFVPPHAYVSCGFFEFWKYLALTACGTLYLLTLRAELFVYFPIPLLRYYSAAHSRAAPEEW